MKYKGRRQTSHVTDVRGPNSKEKFAQVVKEETVKALQYTKKINDNPNTMGRIQRPEPNEDTFFKVNRK